MSQPVPVALLLAAGDGIGAAVARRFAREGLHVVVVRRSVENSASLVQQIQESGGTVTALASDVRDEEKVVELFERVERDIGPIDVCVYNGGANTAVPLVETSAKLFQKVWELGCFGAFLAAREAAKVMLPRGRGTILFSGATSGIRGKSTYTAFSAAKFGMRSIAESVAKELGPKGIHVAHLMIDGGIESADIARLFRERADVDTATLPEDTLMNPDDLAEAYWFLYNQPRTCWTNELNLRSHRTGW